MTIMLTYRFANVLVHLIQENVLGLCPIGSYYRENQDIEDIEFVTTRNMQIIVDEMIEYFNVIVTKQDHQHVQVKLFDMFIDIWFVDNDSELQFVKWMRRCTPEENKILCKRAKAKYMTLTDRGLMKNNKMIRFTRFNDLKSYIEK